MSINFENPEPSGIDKVEEYFGEDTHIKELKKEIGDDWFLKLTPSEQSLSVRFAHLWEKLMEKKEDPTREDREMYDDVMSQIPGFGKVDESDLLHKDYFGMLNNKATALFYVGKLSKIKNEE